MKLEGRVFERWQLFATLPKALQDQTLELCVHLTSIKEALFVNHHSKLMKSVRAVRGKALLETIEKWLKEQRDDEEVNPTHVKELAEAVVLGGFVTPLKEVDRSPRKKFSRLELIQENELLIPVAKDVCDLKSTSVWHVVDGAMFAGWIKWKHGLLAHFTQGKDVYAVVNQKTMSLILFESDLARGPLVECPLVSKFVAFDQSQFEFGIKVWNDEASELLNACSHECQNRLVDALVDAGAQYREALTMDLSSVQSFYDLKDRDMNGTEVSMDKYKGKVVLVVNVACQCGLTHDNYHALSALYAKYHQMGLEILAFPCNQFGAQEAGSHEEIMNFVKQYDCRFDFFEKGDVNGAQTRPVFAYLKQKLPGAFGDFIKWNFTKFLVDRHGQPYKRFAPHESPFAMTQAIEKLLQKDMEGNEDEPFTKQPHVVDKMPHVDNREFVTPAEEHQEDHEAQTMEDDLAEETTKMRITTPDPKPKAADTKQEPAITEEEVRRAVAP